MEKSEHYSSQNSLYDAIDESRALMTDKDKHIYNLLQRSTIKKVYAYSFTMQYLYYTKYFIVANILQLGARASRQNSSTSENRTMS